MFSYIYLGSNIDLHLSASYVIEKSSFRRERYENITHSSAQDAGAPHLSQLPSGGVQLVGSELAVEAIVKISAEGRLKSTQILGYTVMITRRIGVLR